MKAHLDDKTAKTSKEVITIEFMTVLFLEEEEGGDGFRRKLSQNASGVTSKVLLLCFIVIIRLYLSFRLFSESVLFYYTVFIKTSNSLRKTHIIQSKNHFGQLLSHPIFTDVFYIYKYILVTGSLQLPGSDGPCHTTSVTRPGKQDLLV